MAGCIWFGDNLIDTDDILEIEEQTVTLKKEKFKVIILKVINERGLYDFYTIYNDKNIINILKKDKKSTLDVGNFYCYFGILQYPDYEETNMRYDASINSKADFIEKYILSDFVDDDDYEPRYRAPKKREGLQGRITITCDDW